MDKKMNDKMCIDPKEFYQGLTKKEKGQFLLFLYKKLRFKMTTMQAKLRKNPRCELHYAERILICDVIRDGEWRSAEAS